MSRSYTDLPLSASIASSETDLLYRHVQDTTQTLNDFDVASGEDISVR
jgi:hypothetical protein